MICIEDHYYKYMDYHIYTLDPTHNLYKPHTHRRLELCIILEGEGSYLIGNTTYPLAKGDIFIIDNKMLHKITVDSNSSVKTMVFHFLPRFFWAGGSDYFNKSYLNAFYLQDEHFNHRLTQDMTVNKSIMPLLNRCAKEFETQELNYDLLVKSLFMTIMVYLNRHYFTREKVKENIKHSELIDLYSMTTVIDYIDTHYMDVIRLKDLADLVHLEASYFTKIFKELNGMTPINYINHVRIEQATKLLSHKDYTLEQISWKCGFKTYSNFSKVFKSINSFSPSHYRNKF